MVLSGWLTAFATRLKWSRARVRRRAISQRRSGAPWGFAIAADVLEERCLLSAAVTGVSPNSGTTNGGSTIYIMGMGFTGVTGVMFGSTAATSYTVNSANNITATVPAHSAGAIEIQVLSTGGNSSLNPTYDTYTYTQAAPTVTSVSPNTGSSTGGTSVTITGTGFTSVSAITFGGTTASSFTVNSSTSITAIAPSHTSGAVDILVVTASGTSSADPSHDQFTYTTTGPTVTGVSPGTGTGSGGTSVTITGTGFTGATAVTFGGTNASSFTVNSSTSITAIAPSHSPGTVDVRVTTSAGQSATTSADQFVYTTPVMTPTVTGLGTSTGSTSGGTSITIFGANFSNVSAVMFGTVAASSFTVNSTTSITAVTPAQSAGTVDVKVTNSAGTSSTSSADLFTYQSSGPVITSISPNSGAIAGGTAVTIVGSNFMGTSAVMFGTVAASSFTLNSPTSLTAYAPAGTAGVVDIKVTTPYGTSATSSADQFTYVSSTLPTVTSLSSTSGSTSGGTTITITGTNFTNVSSVMFGSVAASSYVVNSSTSISATAPAQSAGTVDVKVTTSAGTSAASTADQFTYSSSSGGSTVVPSVMGLSALNGSTSGGTSVQIYGTGFSGANAVKFGTTPATSYTIDSDGMIIAVAPAHASGMVDVTVTTPSGTSTTNSYDQFTYDSASSPPTVTGLSRRKGSTAGGDFVTISGTNLQAVRGVSFGGVAATLFVAESDSSIVVLAPAAAAGTVDVRVTTGGGTSTTSTADQYQFVAPATSGATGVAGPAQASTTPTVTGLSVTSGASAGGDTVTISGTNLEGVTRVYFGTNEATGVIANPDGTLTVTTPAGVVGVVHVTVKAFGGSSATSTADQFTYAAAPAAPTITALNTAIGSFTGGSVVTITGTNFTQVRGVAFGDRQAVSFTVNSPTSITAVAPGHSAGVVDIKVTTTGGTSSTVTADQFTFSKSSPIVTGLDVSSGFSNGGTTVTLFGGNLASVTSVYFGTVACTSFTINADGTITATAPAQAAGTVDVTVSGTYGKSAPQQPDRFTYITAGTHPVVNALSTSTGPAGGGTLVMISGANFVGVTSVTFGGIAAPFFQVLSPETLVARSPAASAAGQVDIVVNSPAGGSATGAADKFTYTIAAPAISSLGAPSGFTTGGDTLTINGSNFTGVTAVSFGGTAATSFTVVSDSQLTVVTPAHAAGQVDITITNPQGTSTIGAVDQFTFTPAGALPTVTSLSTTYGSAFGGTTVLISGTNFTNVTAIKFGTVAATQFTIKSPTQISVVTPAVPVGPVDVCVTTSTGTSATSSADQFTFTMSAPTVSAISNPSGFSSGGASVTIYGENLAQATGVYFGSTAATSFSVNQDGSLTAVAPAATAGSVHITVQTPGGTSATGTSDQFVVTPAGALPTVIALSASGGSTLGGQTITIIGTNFTGVTGVSFGGVAAQSFTVDSPTSLTVVTPAKTTGMVDVLVTTSAGTSAVATADQFTYQLPAPIVTAIDTPSGISTGGDSVTISGINLAGVTAVFFGPTAATSFTVNADGSITAVAPAQAVGTYDITVQTPSGTSATSPADQFLVTAAGALPTVTALGLTEGETTGGDIVTITGTNFTRVTGVSFGGVAAKSFSVVSPTKIVATTPAVLAATVDVKVTTSAGTSTASAADFFTFTAPAPLLMSLSASSGFTTGGDTVRIYGSDFDGATGVFFGGTAATSFTLNADSSITAVAPAKSAGSYDVTVQTPAGTTASSAEARFTYTQAGAAPTVTALSTAGGATAGGQLVAITGTGFTNITDVKFGGLSAAAFYVTSDKSIIALSPPAAAGDVNVTVTNAAGTSATSTASAFGFSPNWAGPTNPGPSQSYVVGGWGSGAPGSHAGIQGTTGSAGAGGLMTSFTAPVEPNVPTINPQYYYNGSTMTITDGGTVVYRSPMSTTLSDGTVITGNYTDTMTFTLSRGSTSGGGGSTHIVRTDNVVQVLNLKKPDGTGYESVGMTKTTVTFDSSSSTVTVDTVITGSSASHQKGVSAQGAHDHAENTDSSSWSSSSHLTSTNSSGVIDVTYTNSEDGEDEYNHHVDDNENLNTENDNLKGSDTWHRDNAGTYHQNTNGTHTAMNDVHSTGSGYDLYSANASDTIGSVTTAAGGTTTLIDSGTSSDMGTDHYSVSSNSMAEMAVDGTVVHTEWHDNHDDGKEDFKVSDKGIVVATSTTADGGTVIATDKFHDANDDDSDYRDSDTETPSGGGGWSTQSTASSGSSGEEDDFKSHDADRDKFNAGDDSSVVLTSVSPFGAVTTVTITGNDSDKGKVKGSDDFEDDEKLATGSASQSDHFIFDDAVSSEDEATDTATIEISTRGLVGAGDTVDRTETITLTGRSKTDSSTMDDGTEDDKSSGDSESDKEVDHGDDEESLTVDVTTFLAEKVLGTDGSEQYTLIRDHVTDTITGKGNSDVTDQHGAKSGAGGGSEIDTDHVTDKGNSTASNRFGDTGSRQISNSMPVTNGSLVITQMGTFGSSDYTSDTVEDDGSSDTQGAANSTQSTTPTATASGSTDTETEDFSDTASSNDDAVTFRSLNLYDAVAGVFTSILSADNTHNQVKDSLSDDERDTVTSGGGGSTGNFHEDDHVSLYSDSGDYGPLSIHVDNPGASSSFHIDLGCSNWADHRAQGEDTATAAGTDSGDVKFQTADGTSVSGRIHSSVTKTVNTDDGQGNTVSSTESLDDPGTLGFMDSDFDDGEDDFADANGQPSSEYEHDTEDEYGYQQVSSAPTNHLHSTLHTVDPSTGLSIQLEINNDNSDVFTASKSGHVNDIHDQSGVAATGTDSIGGDQELHEHEVTHGNSTATTTTDGTTSTGKQVHLVETVTTIDDETDDSEDDDVGGKSGSSHDTETLTVNNQATVSFSDSLVSTVTSIDPASGIRTVVSDTMTIGGSGNEHDQDSETDVRQSGSAESDTFSESDTGGETVTWTISDTTTRTNPDGSSAGAPVTRSDSGGNSLDWQTSVSKSVGGVVTRTGSTTQSGNDTPTNTGTSSTSWSNQSVAVPLDAAFADHTGPASSPSSGSGTQDSAISFLGSVLGLKIDLRAVEEMRSLANDARKEIEFENDLRDRWWADVDPTTGRALNRVSGFAASAAFEVWDRMFALDIGMSQATKNLINGDVAALRNSASAATASGVVTLTLPIAEASQPIINATPFYMFDVEGALTVLNQTAYEMDPVAALNGDTGVYLALAAGTMVAIEADAVAASRASGFELQLGGSRNSSLGAASFFDETFAQNRMFNAGETALKHGPKPRVVGGKYIGKAPVNGQFALDNSVPISPNSARRIGIDLLNDEIVILDRTGDLLEGGQIVGGRFHGHVRSWSMLDKRQQDALIRAGLVDSKGRIRISSHIRLNQGNR